MPAAEVSTWRDSDPYAMIAGNSGSSTLNWKTVVAFPSTDYGGFIWPSIYLTIACTGLLFTLIVCMLVVANSMKSDESETRKSDEMHNSMEIIEGGAKSVFKMLNKVQVVLTSSDDFEANANEESDFRNDLLAHVITPFQKKQHRQIELLYLVVRVASVMWLFLWIWW